MNKYFSLLITLVVGNIMLNGCKPYKEHIMFKAPEEYSYADFKAAALDAEKNYVIQVNDYIRVSVFTNDGERIIDPDFELLKEMPNNQVNTRPDPEYLVREDGYVRLPLIGDVKLIDLTIEETSQYLQERYNEYYTSPYVLVEFANKRVVVLGSAGGQVIPLTNENITVAEVIALSGGMQKEGKAHNIRLLRDQEIFLINLSTIDGYLNSNMIVQPGDIVYVEPIQRVAAEFARDITPWVALITSLTTLILVIIN